MNYEQNNSESTINEFEKALRDIARAVQAEILRGLLTLTAEYVFDTKKRLTFSVANIRRGRTASVLINSALAQSRPNFLQRIIAAFLRLVEKNTDYFAAQGLTAQSEGDAVDKILLLYGYNRQTGEVVPDSYLDATLNTTQVAQRVGRALTTSLTSKETLNQMRRRLRSILRPTDGELVRHIDRYSGDLFAAFDQSIHDEQAERLGLTLSVYAGTAVDDTRPFCLARLNRVYTNDEIASWNRSDWKGKNKTLPVEIANGGYRCRHKRNFVSDQVGAVIAKQRGGVNTYAAPDKGFI